MAVKILAAFKRPAIIGVALLCFLVTANWAARAGTTNQAEPVWKQPNSYTVIVAQNETQTATNDKNAPSSESKKPESKTDEKRESTGVKKSRLKIFNPRKKLRRSRQWISHMTSSFLPGSGSFSDGLRSPRILAFNVLICTPQAKTLVRPCPSKKISRFWKGNTIL